MTARMEEGELGLEEMLKLYEKEYDCPQNSRVNWIPPRLD